MIAEVPRPAEDILSRSLRLTLGGHEYVLRVLFIAGNERWRKLMDERTSAFVDEMAALGNDTSAILAKFAAQPDLTLELLYAYDTDCDRRPGVLPPVEQLKEEIYEDEVEAALREVVKAANPKAAAAATLLTAGPTTNGSSPPSSTPSPRGAGRPTRSGRN